MHSNNASNQLFQQEILCNLHPKDAYPHNKHTSTLRFLLDFMCIAHPR